MLDLRLIRRDPDAVRAALARRGDAERLDEVLDLDEDWRAANAAAGEPAPRAEGGLGRASPRPSAPARTPGRRSQRMRDMSAQVKALTERARTAEERLQARARDAARTCPTRPPPTEDTVLREVGEPRIREGRDHLELAGDRIDMERGARLSGSRFAYLRGDARAARARARPLGAREARAATASSR